MTLYKVLLGEAMPVNIEYIFVQDENHLPLTPSMEALMTKLRVICDDPKVTEAFNDAISKCALHTAEGMPNPWIGRSVADLVQFFRNWFTFLPIPSSGFGYILPFSWFYLNNPAAKDFLNKFRSNTSGKRYSAEIFNWTREFILERGRFMDSPESTPNVKVWIEHLADDMDNFIVPKGGYKSFNEFFSRKLNLARNPRPIHARDDDSVLTCTADAVIDLIRSDLTLETNIEVKGRHLNVTQLLNSSAFAREFIGGTALSAILTPDAYHHYHAPVSGEIVESADIPGIYNGIMDGQHWFNRLQNIDIGESEMDYCIFEEFHRSYFVIKTAKYGYVAVIPVGLNTISRMRPSIVNHQSTMVPPGSPPVQVRKGDELGYFQFGGSLNILLFQKGVFSAINVRMGQRIGKLSPPTVQNGTRVGRYIKL